MISSECCKLHDVSGCYVVKEGDIAAYQKNVSSNCCFHPES
ncbi:hypothetical protein Hdeb2414_s0013g00403701 [Helianthus debilis subsp. tardiflorus]